MNKAEKREWAAKGHVFDMTKPFEGQVLELTFTEVDPELIKLVTDVPAQQKVKGDPWANLSTYSCSTCRFFVPKREADGRCRRHAPTMDGYPVVYPADWCGDHKLGTNPSREK